MKRFLVRMFWGVTAEAAVTTGVAMNLTGAAGAPTEAAAAFMKMTMH